MKEENILREAKQKFADTRVKCPGMSDEIYALTDYISSITHDSLVPNTLVLILLGIMYGLKSGKNGFKPNTPLPEYLKDHKNQILTQMVYIPQVVDAIADENFANEFRILCKEAFGFDPPKRVNGSVDSKYPEFVRVAVDWWANAIQSPKLDNGDNNDMFSYLKMVLASSSRSLSEEEIKIFKDSLAKDIIAELLTYGNCYLSVDYEPCETLYNAGEKIGLDSLSGYPWKTEMEISFDSVKVSEGYGAKSKVIWTNEKRKNFDESTNNNKKHI